MKEIEADQAITILEEKVEHIEKQRDELLEAFEQLKAGHYERVKSYVGQQLPHWAIKYIELQIKNATNEL